MIPAMLTLVSAVPRHLQTPPDGSQCVDGYVDLSFDMATTTQNNLGGNGPDDGEESIVFSNVANHLGDSINLVLSIKPGADYELTDLERNGMICNTPFNSCEEGGDFGQVNVKANTETTLLFQFQKDSTGEPVQLPGFLFTGLDIDGGGPMEEVYVVKGWDTAFYDRSNSEAFFSEDKPGFCDSAGESCLYAEATNNGAVCDNPTDAFNLDSKTCAGRTVNQRARAFMVSFTDKSEFEVFFKVTREDRDYSRNFVFAFSSSLADECQPPTGQPTMPPTGQPTMAPVTGQPTMPPVTGQPTPSPAPPEDTYRSTHNGASYEQPCCNPR